MAKRIVKKGDTLGKIAQQEGVKVSDITGFKSGNPNLIFPGEELSFGEDTTQTTQDIQNQPIKENEAIDITQLDKPTTDLSNLPTATEEDVFLPAPITAESTVEDVFKEPEETETQKRQKIAQARISELRGEQATEETFRGEQEEEKGISKLKSVNTDLTRRFNEIIDKGTAEILQIEENQKGRGITIAAGAHEIADARRNNAIEAFTIKSLLSASQGNLAQAQGEIDRAIKMKYDPIERELALQLEQLGFIEDDLTAEEKKQAEVVKANLKERTRLIGLQKSEKESIQTLGLEVARLQQAPMDVMDKIMNSKTFGEAMIHALPYMTTKESNEIKTIINDSKGLTGKETLKPGILEGFSEEKKRISNLIADAFPENPKVALAIAIAESNLETGAHGDKNNKLAPEGSHGIFQINTAVHKDLIGDRDVNNVEDNIEIAREIFDNNGGSWNPWGSFTDGRYKENLEKTTSGLTDIQKVGLARAVYGKRISDGERESFGEILEEDPSLTAQDAILQLQNITELPKGEEGLFNKLLDILRNSDLEKGPMDYNLKGIANALQKGDREQAIRSIENKTLQNSASGTDAFVIQNNGQKIVKLIHKASELAEKVDSSQLGLIDAETGKFIRKTGIFGDIEEISLDAQKLESKLVAVFQEYKNENLGTAITETELKSIAPLMATISDQPELLSVKLEEFNNLWMNEINNNRKRHNLPETTLEVITGKDKLESLYAELQVNEAPEADTLTDEEAWELFNK